MRRLRTATLAWILVLMGAGFSTAADVDVDVRVVDGWMLVDASTSELVDDDVVRALRSGLPSRITVEVELWVERGALWDRFVVGQRIESRVIFDVLEERYEVFDESGERVLTVDERAAMADYVQSIVAYPLETTDVLDADDRAYASVSLRVEPLTVQEMRDLERWLQGNLRENEGSLLGRLSRQLFGVVKGRVGLGDREVRGRSASFRVRDD